eukprot:gene3539-4042_t
MEQQARGALTSDSEAYETGRARATENERTQLQMADNNETIDGDASATLNFYLLIGIVEVVGIIILAVVFIWMGHYRGGFAWNGSAKEFNYHPVFMTIGFIFLYGNGMLVYRILRKTNKMTVKIVHACIQLGALIFAIVGLKAVFDFHNSSKIPNMYTLHSWVGITTTVLFGLQWLFGFFGFLFPKFSDARRADYLKTHQYFGLAIIILAAGTCLSGITEKLFFSVKNYSKYPAEGILANSLGLFLVIFIGLVAHLVTKPSFQRPPDAEVVYSKIH